MRIDKNVKAPPAATPSQYAVRLDEQLTDNELACIIIDTPFGQLHLAGKIRVFDNDLLEIEDALIYARDGLSRGALGPKGIVQTARAVMEILNVKAIKISGFRATGAKPGHQSRTKTFRR